MLQSEKTMSAPLRMRTIGRVRHDNRGDTDMSSTSPAAFPAGQTIATPDGLRLHYLDAGTGEPAVFVHGSGPGASGHSNFKHNAPAFVEAGFRTVVVDLPGYGQSSKPADVEYTLDFFVAALRAQLLALELPRCVLVGNSLGGAIALKYALDYPEHVSRLVMMAPGGVEDRETYFRMEGIEKMVSLFTGGHMNHDPMRQLLKLLVHDATLVTDALVDERMAVCKEQPREVLATMKVPNLTERLGEIACPGARLLGHGRPLQSGRRGAQAPAKVPRRALRADQSLRPLGDGGALRLLQPRVPGLPGGYGRSRGVAWPSARCAGQRQDK